VEQSTEFTGFPGHPLNTFQLTGPDINQMGFNPQFFTLYLKPAKEGFLSFSSPADQIGRFLVDDGALSQVQLIQDFLHPLPLNDRNPPGLRKIGNQPIGDPPRETSPAGVLAPVGEVQNSEGELLPSPAGAERSPGD